MFLYWAALLRLHLEIIVSSTYVSRTVQLILGHTQFISPEILFLTGQPRQRAVLVCVERMAGEKPPACGRQEEGELRAR